MSVLSSQCGSDRVIYDRDVITVRFHSKIRQGFTEALTDLFPDHVLYADLLASGAHDGILIPLGNRGKGKTDADMIRTKIGADFLCDLAEEAGGIRFLLYPWREEGEKALHAQDAFRSKGDHCAAHIGASDVDHRDRRRTDRGTEGSNVRGNHFDPVSIPVKNACTYLIHFREQLLQLRFHIDLVSAHMMASEKLLCCGARPGCSGSCWYHGILLPEGIICTFKAESTGCFFVTESMAILLRLRQSYP